MDTRYEVRDAQEVCALLADTGKGRPERAKIAVAEKGGPVPALPAWRRLVNGAGGCWEAAYGAPAIRNDAGQFRTLRIEVMPRDLWTNVRRNLGADAHGGPEIGR